MRTITTTVVVLAAAIAALWATGGLAAEGTKPAIPTGPIKAEVRKVEGKWQLFRDGKPYFVKGGYCLQPGIPVKAMAEAGGNSLRIFASKQIMDEAHALGLSVAINVDIPRPPGFNWDDAKAIEKLMEERKKLVLNYKDHPAMFLWLIGNENDGVLFTHRREAEKMFRATNELSKWIHQVDPSHLTTTIIAQVKDFKHLDVAPIVDGLCPDLDLICVNSYGDSLAVALEHLDQINWPRPYLVTEWGPTGYWMVKGTPWNASIEETSTQRAATTQKAYKEILKRNDRCLGSYLFIWSYQVECSPTWFNVHLKSGEHTESFDVMHHYWKGAWPENRSPRIIDMTLDGKHAADGVYLKPGGTAVARLRAEDPNKDRLTVRWILLPDEPGKYGTAEFEQKKPEAVVEMAENAAECSLDLKVPHEERSYRLFAYVLDGKGAAATANVPFYVRP